MNSVMPFDNGEFVIEVVPDDVDGFRVRAPGLAKALGFREARDMIRSLSPEMVGSELSPTPGGAQNVWYVTERGFYQVLGQRQVARIKNQVVRAQVQRFQDWVYGEVLPGIRRGTLSLPTSRVEALRALADSLEALDEANREIERLSPMAKMAQELISAEGDYCLRDAAQILVRGGVETGQNRLAAWMRNHEWTSADGRPYQEKVDSGLLNRKAGFYHHPKTGTHVATSQVRITPKGLDTIYKAMTAATTKQLELLP